MHHSSSPQKAFQVTSLKWMFVLKVFAFTNSSSEQVPYFLSLNDFWHMVNGYVAEFSNKRIWGPSKLKYSSSQWYWKFSLNLSLMIACKRTFPRSSTHRMGSDWKSEIFRGNGFGQRKVILCLWNRIAFRKATPQMYINLLVQVHSSHGNQDW